MGFIALMCWSASILVFSVQYSDAFFGNTNFNFDTDISFLIYDWTQTKFIKQTTAETNFAAVGCKTTDPFVIVVHGWTEGCNTRPWVPNTLNNFVIYRKGCVLCMDYSVIALNNNYFTVASMMDSIARTLEKKIRQLIAYGIPASRGMLYGFSLGANVAFQAGRNLAPAKLDRIDACDPAGVSFDQNATYIALSVTDSAREVQCIHTSSDLGTARRDCHKDWLTGYCGWLQFFAGPITSHAYCPLFYNAAFMYDFNAIPNPYYCPTTRAVSSWPSGFKMGYFMPQGTTLMGDLFVKTSKNFPYN